MVKFQIAIFSLFLFIGCTGEQLISPDIQVSAENFGELRYNFVSPQKVAISGTNRFDLYFTQPGTSNTNAVVPILDSAVVDLVNQKLPLL